MNEDFLSDKLRSRTKEGVLRKLPVRLDGIDFSSNDYLGLTRDEILHSSIIRKITEEAAAAGSTGSRLLTGNSQQHLQLEAYFSTYFETESTLLFSSGYSANLAILSSVPQRGDTIAYDDYCHASIKDGIRLSNAEFVRFKHNDANDLNKKLAHAVGRKFIVVESVYSMDGDLCNFEELNKVVTNHQAHLIVDEAHSTGIYGQNGNGLVNQYKLDVFARIYTFGKGLGTHGACIAGSKTLIDYLINFARQFIYTTATSPSQLIAIQESFSHVINNPQLREDLNDNISHFQKTVKDSDVNGLFISNPTPIQGIIGQGNVDTKLIANELQSHGYSVLPILSPTVPEGKERIRICLHSYNTKEQIENLVSSVSELMQ